MLQRRSTTSAHSIHILRVRTRQHLALLWPDVNTAARESLDGRPVRIIVVPNSEGGSSVHIVVNAYDASPQTAYSRWAADGLDQYVDQERFPAILTRSGRQLPGSAFQN